MADFDWKAAVKTVAPVLGTALGGPLAGAAVKVLGEVLLGNPNATEVEVAAAAGAMSGDQIVAMRRADNEFKARIVEAGVKIEEIDAKDRDSARQRQAQTKDPTNAIIAFIVIGVWGLINYNLFTTVAIPETARDLIVRLLGTLDSALMLVLYFYFGSSRGSREKDAALRDAVRKDGAA